MPAPNPAAIALARQIYLAMPAAAESRPTVQTGSYDRAHICGAYNLTILATILLEAGYRLTTRPPTAFE